MYDGWIGKFYGLNKKCVDTSAFLSAIVERIYSVMKSDWNEMYHDPKIKTKTNLNYKIFFFILFLNILITNYDLTVL